MSPRAAVREVMGPQAYVTADVNGAVTLTQQARAPSIWRNNY
jgi:L-alanine-DL-glutamate epimerase-like enolase superfamily enzyme